MRLVVHGQQAFGKAVLENLLERGEDIVGVFCAPQKEGRPIDPLLEFAVERGLTVHQPTSWKNDEALQLIKSFRPDLCVMAFVTLLVSEEVLNAPTHGTIQYHPSLLPLHRGPSSINWPIIKGATETGLSIFWPDEGLDEGPILIQKRIDIGPNDTLGSIYFNHLFPMGVDAMVEGVDLVRAGNPPRIEQDHSRATYESWCRRSDVQVNWSKPGQEVYNLIRGANPQPGAFTVHDGKDLQIFDCKMVDASGAPGEVVDASDAGITVAAESGGILMQRVRPLNSGKIPASEFIATSGISKGTLLG
ncbi:MAG: methionyl-tRNA formyltransferase [Pseudomonadota bacterium]|nr:methionyl-tRNA formyltransferase [Pseudomonadota bacterium]